jgi:Ca2+-binding RTX toxin-like protein
VAEAIPIILNSISTALIAGTITTLLLLVPTLSIVGVWADNVFGTRRADTLVGTNNDDNIFGQQGDDSLSGEEGDDYIEGNTGNDTISDGLGSDIIWAGSGNDTLDLNGIGEDEEDTGGGARFDEIHGDSGRDIINSSGDDVGFLLIYGGDDDDNVTATSDETSGKIYGDDGNDNIHTCCDTDYDVWGGPGNDVIEGSSECTLGNVDGGSGNDTIFQADDFTIGGSGNDIIEFLDCSGVAYGGPGNDELSGGDDSPNLELHGDNGDDNLTGSNTGDPDQLFGEDGNDTLNGGVGATSFSCGSGTDTITNFDTSKGDTKTADCENFLPRTQFSSSLTSFILSS